MNLIQEALSLGFANAAVIDVKDLVFVLEYRKFCEENLCGNYGLVPACPPACGTAEEMRERPSPIKKLWCCRRSSHSPRQIRLYSKKPNMSIISLRKKWPTEWKPQEPMTC